LEGHYPKQKAIDFAEGIAQLEQNDEQMHLDFQRQMAE
jgi:hypothetical protein